MSEKEIKKIDEKGEEKVSGGADLKKILEDTKIKSNVDVLSIVTYGGPLIRPFRRPDDVIKKLKDKDKKEKNPEDALATSQPQDGEKK